MKSYSLCLWALGAMLASVWAADTASAQWSSYWTQKTDLYADFARDAETRSSELMNMGLYGSAILEAQNASMMQRLSQDTARYAEEWRYREAQQWNSLLDPSTYYTPPSSVPSYSWYGANNGGWYAAPPESSIVPERLYSSGSMFASPEANSGGCDCPACRAARGW